METALHAERDGTVAEVLVRAGDQIDAKDLLVVFGPPLLSAVGPPPPLRRCVSRTPFISPCPLRGVRTQVRGRPSPHLLRFIRHAFPDGRRSAIGPTFPPPVRLTPGSTDLGSALPTDWMRATVDTSNLDCNRHSRPLGGRRNLPRQRLRRRQLGAADSGVPDPARHHRIHARPADPAVRRGRRQRHGLGWPPHSQLRFEDCRTSFFAVSCCFGLLHRRPGAECLDRGDRHVCLRRHDRRDGRLHERQRGHRGTKLGRAIMSSSHGFWSLGGFVGGGLGGIAIQNWGHLTHAAVVSAVAIAVVAGVTSPFGRRSSGRAGTQEVLAAAQPSRSISSGSWRC